MMSDFFEYHCGFLDERLQFVDAIEASADLAREGLFHSWFQWTQSPQKSEVLKSWSHRFGKNSLLLIRADSGMDQIIGKIFEGFGIEVLNVDSVGDNREYQSWVCSRARRWQLTDPRFACFAFHSEQKLAAGREVLWTFPVFEIKDMNWQFTDPRESGQVISQDQPHWVINDFATSLTPYLLSREFACLHWGLALELIPAFLKDIGFFNNPGLFREQGRKNIHEVDIARWLDPSEDFTSLTSAFELPKDTKLVPQRGRSYNLPVNCIFPGA